jgi:RNA polymerase sigma-70 factor (sigma-E family)
VRSWDDQFTAYFNAHVHRLRRLGYALSGDWHAAEDLVQVTFVRLHRAWARADKTTLDPYVRRILVNAFLTDRRARRREVLVAEPPDHPAPHGDADARIAVRRALHALPPKQRAAVVLRYLEDLSVPEVAAVLGIREGTVKSQTARGIESLRGVLGDAVLTRE